MKRHEIDTTLFVTLLLFFLFSFPACAIRRDVPAVKTAGVGRLAEVSTEQARLYVVTASQTVEVRDIDAVSKQVEALIQKNGGYVQSQSLREDERAYLVLRVPSQQLRPVLDEIAALGNEEARSVSSQDVTEQYIDSEARLKNSTALRDRLKALLNQARDVKDVLEIEKELARVQADIDSLEGRLKKLKGQVDLAQLDLTLKRKKILGPLGYIGYGIGWLIEKLFVIK